MKRILIICLTFLLFTLFHGCNFIPHQGERPFDYPPARWISENPNIWFDVVSHDGNPSRRSEPKGKVELTGRSVEIIVGFDITNRIFVRENINASNPQGFNGTCKFNPEKLIVTVNKEKDTLFHGEYDTITFIRIPRDGND